MSWYDIFIIRQTDTGREDEMTYTTRKISEARQNLKDGGFRFTGFGQLTGAEMYAAPGCVAMIRKVPFKGYRVRIDAAA